MAFEPVNDLEKMLVAAADEPAFRPDFYRRLIESDIFLISHGPVPEKPGHVLLKQGRTIQLESIEFEGQHYLPIFTSIQRLQEYVKEEVGYIGMNALVFLKGIKDGGIILNPGSIGKEFSYQEIESIVDGSIWNSLGVTFVAKKDTQVFFGQPATFPKDLVDALARFFKTANAVKRAYLAHFYNPEVDKKPHSLIGLEVDGNWDEILSSVGIIVKNTAVPNPPVDFYRIEGKESEIEAYFREECKPFYERRLFGIF